VLCDFGHDRRRLAVDDHVKLERTVKFGKRIRGELNVDDGADDGHDAAFLECVNRGIGGEGHCKCS